MIRMRLELFREPSALSAQEIRRFVVSPEDILVKVLPARERGAGAERARSLNLKS